MTLIVLAGLPQAPAAAQQTARVMLQDSTLDNLADPPGYRTALPGTLGAVSIVGSGARPMVLVPGFGFGADLYSPLVENWDSTFTMYAVTLPGFGGTAAPPSPAPGTSFGEQTWTNGAVDAIERLLVERDLRDVVVVGHWLGGTQVALRLARRQPERVSAVVLLAGSARMTSTAPGAPAEIPLDRRIAFVDASLAPNWFRTVTRETWDDNNFLPGDYAANPILGLRHWREAARPPLHVWVRYLCEFSAQDATLVLPEVRARVLLLVPGLDGLYVDGGNHYMDAFLRRSWGGVLNAPGITVQTIPGARVVLWSDQLHAVSEAIDRFLLAARSPG